MSRALSFLIALAATAASPHALAQGHVIMTPQLVDATRKFTVHAPYPDYPASARARHLQGSGIYLLHLRRDGTVERVEIVQSTVIASSMKHVSLLTDSGGFVRTLQQKRTR